MERLGERGIWWEAKTDPRYGDITAFYDERSDYFYAIGGAPITFEDYVGQGYVYQVRARRKDAFDLSKYEYWWGRKVGWSKNRLTEFYSESAIMWNVGQGQMVYNRHCACYIFVHTSECSLSFQRLLTRAYVATDPGSNQVVLRTASAAEGPWSEDVVVHEAKVRDEGE